MMLTLVLKVILELAVLQPKMQAIRRATLSGTYTVIASGYEDGHTK
jgi:hypothetical protein